MNNDVIGQVKIRKGEVTVRRNIEKVEFNPSNKDHIEAYKMLLEGKLHPTLRFNVPHHFVDQLQYLDRKVALHYLNLLN